MVELSDQLAAKLQNAATAESENFRVTVSPHNNNDMYPWHYNGLLKVI